VNRGRRMKLRFATVKTKSKDVLRKSLTTYYDVGDALDPALHPAIAKDIVIVGRDAFFGSIVVYFADQAITIRDIVTFGANIAGGVHAPNPAKEAAHQGLDALRQHVIMKGQSISLYHLRNVGKLVLDALKPLRGRVEYESSAG
jgi:hypothetical protein